MDDHILLGINFLDKDYVMETSSVRYYKNKVVNNFLQSVYENDFMSLYAIKGNVDLTVAIIVKDYYGHLNGIKYHNPLDQKFLVEHWNLHPLRKSLTKTHETFQYITNADCVKETFKSLLRLTES